MAECVKSNYFILNILKVKGSRAPIMQASLQHYAWAKTFRIPLTKGLFRVSKILRVHLSSFCFLDRIRWLRRSYFNA